MTPCRSALSIGGLIKHITYGMRGATTRLSGHAATPPVIDDEAYAAYQSSFALTGDETVTGAIAAFDTARIAYLAAVAATDPAANTIEPPAPWHGIYDARPANA